MRGFLSGPLLHRNGPSAADTRFNIGVLQFEFEVFNYSEDPRDLRPGAGAHNGASLEACAWSIPKWVQSDGGASFHACLAGAHILFPREPACNAFGHRFPPTPSRPRRAVGK